MKKKNYLINQKIGTGSFSTVYKATDLTNPTNTYALKVIKSISTSKKLQIKNQINLMRSINHRNVVNYITDFQDQGQWYIVMEYCEKGDLESYYKKQGKLPQKFCKNLAYSMIEVFTMLHAKGIAHRDLKLSNILITKDYDFKLADFGLAKNGILQSYCGTPIMMAPQVLRRQSYDHRCQTWSLGILIYQLLFGKYPFNMAKYGAGKNALIKAALKEQPDFDVPEVEVSDDCIDFIGICLEKDKDKRPYMKILREHRWLNIIGNTQLRKKINKSTLKKNTMQSIVQFTLYTAIKQHIEKLISSASLSNIETYLQLVDNCYPENIQLKKMMLLIMSKIVAELESISISMEIQKKIIIIEIMSVNSFCLYRTNLKNTIEKQMEKLINITTKNQQNQLIKFAINQSQICLTSPHTPKTTLLRYLLKLPTHKPQTSTLLFKWIPNSGNTPEHQNQTTHIHNMSNQQIYQSINKEHSGIDRDQIDWIFEHQCKKEIRDGEIIKIGDTMGKIIDMNLQP